jgi:predicted transcriptional regulator
VGGFIDKLKLAGRSRQLLPLTVLVDMPAFLLDNPHTMKSPKFLLRGFRRPSEVATLALGKLERQVLDETWRRGEVSVRDVFLGFEEKIAYTTLMTTLDRLFKKRLLDRRKDGRAFLYSPALSEKELEQGITQDVIDGLLGHGATSVEPVLACIVDTVSEHDRELLDELDRLVKEKKRQLRRLD